VIEQVTKKQEITEDIANIGSIVEDTKVISLILDNIVEVEDNMVE